MYEKGGEIEVEQRKDLIYGTEVVVAGTTVDADLNNLNILKNVPDDS